MTFLFQLGSLKQSEKFIYAQCYLCLIDVKFIGLLGFVWIIWIIFYYFGAPKYLFNAQIITISSQDSKVIAVTVQSSQQ